jgi:uncharacterized protein (DUF4415 family)
MKEKNITIISRDDPRRGKTNLEKLRKLTDEEINASIAGDPDWDEEGWTEAVIIVPPKKQPISIRVDEDVLDFFKKQGAGYQKRINAVLRSFMNASQKSNKRA